MTEISFEVRGNAVPQGSKNSHAWKDKATGALRSCTYDQKSEKLKTWRTAIAQEARKMVSFYGTDDAWHQLPLLEGALEVECAFTFMPVKSRKKQGRVHFQRPDIDKLLRAVLDACTGVIWHDDAQVMRLTGTKEYGDIPGCRIMVRTCSIIPLCANQGASPPMNTDQKGCNGVRAIPFHIPERNREAL